MSNKKFLKKKNYKTHAIVYSILFVFFLVYMTIFIVHKEAISSFKRLYTEYTKTLQDVVLEMEGDTGCYFSTEKGIPNDFSGCERFYKKFATKLRVSKYCKDNALKNGCIPAYKNYINTPQCAGFSENMMTRHNQSFIMGNTTTLTVYNRPENSPKPIMAVDSNGKIFPNKAGYDLFSLVIMRTSGGDYYFHSNITYCLPLEKGGISKLQDVYK